MSLIDLKLWSIGLLHHILLLKLCFLLLLCFLGHLLLLLSLLVWILLRAWEWRCLVWLELVIEVVELVMESPLSLIVWLCLSIVQSECCHFIWVSYLKLILVAILVDRVLILCSNWGGSVKVLDVLVIRWLKDDVCTVAIRFFWTLIFLIRIWVLILLLERRLCLLEWFALPKSTAAFQSTTWNMLMSCRVMMMSKLTHWQRMELIHEHLMLSYCLVLVESSLEQRMKRLHRLIHCHRLMIEMTVHLWIIWTSYKSRVIHTCWLEEPILIVQLLWLLAHVVHVCILLLLIAFQTFWVITSTGRWLTPRILISRIYKVWINGLPAFYNRNFTLALFELTKSLSFRRERRCWCKLLEWTHIVAFGLVFGDSMLIIMILLLIITELKLFSHHVNIISNNRATWKH